MVRMFEDADIVKCAAIMQAVYNNEIWQCRWNDDTAYAYLRDFVEHRKFVGFILVEDNEVVGAVLCRERVWWNNSELYIEEMFVSPQFQRRGYGQRLLRAIERYVNEKQLAGITLSTNRFSFAPDFYRKNGFIDGEHVLFMYKV